MMSPNFPDAITAPVLLSASTLHSASLPMVLAKAAHDASRRTQASAQEAKDANKLSEADTQLNINDTWKYSPYNTISSLVIPGSGQLAQGKRQQGMSILLLQTVTLSGLIVSEYNFNLNSRAYHKATQPEEFDSKYDLANNWNKARWSFFAASVAIYVFAQAEFFLLPPNVSLSCGDCDPIDNISTVINPANDTLSPFVKLSVNF